MTLFKSLADLC